MKEEEMKCWICGRTEEEVKRDIIKAKEGSYLEKTFEETIEINKKGKCNEYGTEDDREERYIGNYKLLKYVDSASGCTYIYVCICMVCEGLLLKKGKQSAYSAMSEVRKDIIKATDYIPVEK